MPRRAPRVLLDGEIARVPLTRGLVAIVDAADAPRVEPYVWYADRGLHTDYALRREAGRGVQMHRHILGLIPGDGRIVDHANNDGLDNRRCNLRLATVSENRVNSQAVHSSTGFRGVYRWRRGRFIAQITYQGKLRHVGVFADPADAARAYDRVARDLFGDFAYQNFPAGGLS